jgi:hypothetical protein
MQKSVERNIFKGDSSKSLQKLLQADKEYSVPVFKK